MNRSGSTILTFKIFVIANNCVLPSNPIENWPPKATIFASRNKKTTYLINYITTLYSTVHTASGAEFDIMAQGWESAYACN